MGGGVMNRSFFYPAIIYPGRRPGMALFHEEQFGPSFQLARYRSGNRHEGIVNSQYRAAMSIFSMDDNLVAAVIDRLVTRWAV